jgi:hypothetical protein
LSCPTVIVCFLWVLSAILKDGPCNARLANI